MSWNNSTDEEHVTQLKALSALERWSFPNVEKEISLFTLKSTIIKVTRQKEKGLEDVSELEFY